MIKFLSKSYSSFCRTQVVSRVHSSIFTKTYFGLCMECDFCNDGCCQYGTEVEIEEIYNIEKYANEIKRNIEKEKKYWFETCQCDDELDCSCNTKCTQVHGRGCVFLNSNGRKCILHSCSIENNIDYHTVKPMVCCLFPTSVINGLLGPAYQVRKNSLSCLGKGPSLYQGVKNEILFYFGKELTDELDKIEHEMITLNDR